MTKNAAPAASEPYTFVIVRPDAPTDFVKFEGYKIGKTNPVSIPVSMEKKLKENEKLAKLIKFS